MLDTQKSKIIALVVAAVVVFMLFAGLSNRYLYASKPSPAPSAAPPEFEPEVQGAYEDYKYTFRKQGEKVAALFLPKMLPRNDAIFISATRHVIKQAFNEEVSSSPTVAGRAIKFSGPSHSFLVVPIKQDTGEVHSLTVERIE